MAHTEGNTLVIEGADFLPSTVDYADIDSIKLLATNAIHTADGFYELVKNNCNTITPDFSAKAHLEIYLALSGLICELYMKAVIYHENLHGGKIIKKHELDVLFEKLPDGVQEILINKINNIRDILPTIKDMFTTLRYDFEQTHIQGDYLAVFKLMEELKTIAHAYPQRKAGAIKYANGALMFE